MSTFIELLRSVRGGSPQYLVHISNPFGDNYYLNNGQKEITISSVVYVPTNMKVIESVNDNADDTKTTTSIEISAKNKTGSDIYDREDVQNWTCKIYGYDVNASDTPLLYEGSIMKVSQSDLSWYKLELADDYNDLQEQGLKSVYTFTCPHSLYDAKCGVDKNNFVETLEVTTGADSRTISAATTKADGYYNNGFVRAGDTGYTTNRVDNHTGTSLGFVTPFQSSKLNGKICSLYAGCDKSHTTCKAKFNNLANFGGNPTIPNTAPNRANNL